MARDQILETLRSNQHEMRRLGVKSLRLFGSAARNEAAEDSDVDLLVDFELPPTFSSYMKLRMFLEDLLSTKVDLVTEGSLKTRLRPHVERDAIRVA